MVNAQHGESTPYAEIVAAQTRELHKVRVDLRAIRTAIEARERDQDNG